MPPETDPRRRGGGPWLIVLVALVGGAGGLMAGRWSSAPTSTPPPSPPPATAALAVGEPATGIALPDLDGVERHIEDFRGRPLLVNFWATWCAPCVKEMPLLDAFASAQLPEGVQVLGVALDRPEAVREFLARVPVGYPILLDRPGPADSSVRLGNARGVLPFSALLDAEGRLLAGHVGDFDAAELDAFVQSRLPPPRAGD